MKSISTLHLSIEYGSKYFGGLGTFVNNLTEQQRSLNGAVVDVCQFDSCEHTFSKVLERVDSSGLDLIHVHDWHFAEIFSKYGWWPTQPMLMTCHMPSVFLGYEDVPSDNRHSLEEALVQRSAIVVSNSRYTEAIISKRYGLNHQKSHVVPNGIPTMTFRPNFGPRVGELIVGAGRLVEQKGWHTFIEAAKGILEFRKNARFFIVGDGVLRESLTTMVEELGLAGFVKFVGHVDQGTLSEIFRRSTIVMVPSVYEPLGQVAIEAMASGACVVASRTGGLREIIESGHNGILVKSGSAREFAEACIQLLESERGQHLIRSRAIRDVSRQYCMKACAERYQSLYRSIL